jgi:hypothetical protein
MPTTWKDSAYNKSYALLASLAFIECSQFKKNALQLRLVAVLRDLLNDGRPEDLAERVRELTDEVEALASATASTAKKIP